MSAALLASTHHILTWCNSEGLAQNLLHTGHARNSHHAVLLISSARASSQRATLRRKQSMGRSPVSANIFQSRYCEDDQGLQEPEGRSADVADSVSAIRATPTAVFGQLGSLRCRLNASHQQGLGLRVWVGGLGFRVLTFTISPCKRLHV